MMLKRRRPWLALLFVAGCAGQLDLAPEAYTSSASQTSNGGGASDAGGVTPSSVGIGSGAPAPWPTTDSDAAAGPVADAGPAKPTPADAWPASDAASASNGGGGAGGGPVTQPAPDASAPVVASVCPPGVEALSLIAKRCGACHSDRMPAKGLDLVTAGVGARLVGVKSSCQNKPLLDAPVAGVTEPTGHFLDKLIGPVAGCGAQMPYGTPALTPGEFDCLVEWSAKAVARGAK